KPDISGIIIPSDKFVSQMLERSALSVEPSSDLETQQPGDIVGIAPPLSMQAAQVQAGAVYDPSTIPTNAALNTPEAASLAATPSAFESMGVDAPVAPTP